MFLGISVELAGTTTTLTTPRATSYNPLNGQLSGLAPSGWSQTQAGAQGNTPLGTDRIWISSARYINGNLTAFDPPTPLTGEQGAQGIQGIQGTQGIQGSPGQDGSDGRNGTNGANGLNGQQLAYLYRVINQGSAVPARPRATISTTGALSGITAGWSANSNVSFDLNTQVVYRAEFLYRPGTASNNVQFGIPYPLTGSRGGAPALVVQLGQLAPQERPRLFRKSEMQILL